MIRTNGSRRLTQLSSQLLSGALVSQSTLCWVSSAFSDSSGKLSRTVVWNLVPSVSSPDTELLSLVSVNCFTWSDCTAVMNSV